MKIIHRPKFKHEASILPIELNSEVERILKLNVLPRNHFWTGTMSGIANFKFLFSEKASYSNPFNIVQTDKYVASSDDSRYFYYIYQTSPIEENALTYLISPYRDLISSKADQIAKWGTYSPNVYKLNSLKEMLPIHPGFEKSFTQLSLTNIQGIFKNPKEDLFTHENYFCTHRLASFMLREVYDFKTKDGQILSFKLFTHHHFHLRKYILEIMPKDEKGGLKYFDDLRYSESNDSWYANYHKMNGPFSTNI